MPNYLKPLNPNLSELEKIVGFHRRLVGYGFLQFGIAAAAFPERR